MTKIVKDKWVVFCEDEKSSLFYLQSLWRIHKDYKNIDIKFDHVPKNGSYADMVKPLPDKIKKLEKENGKKYKNKYLIVDLDEMQSNKSKKLQFDNMLNIAKENNIELIYCDPNFEMFILLHFELCAPTDKNCINDKVINYINKKFQKNIKSIDDIKKDLDIFKKLCENSEMVKLAVKNNENICKNNSNKMNFCKLINFIISNATIK